MNFPVDWKSRKLQFVLVAGLVFLLAVWWLWFPDTSAVSNVTARTLDKYQEKLQEKPLDSTLLLQTARHHYHYVRNRLKDGGNEDSQRPEIKRALQYYRRILSSDDLNVSAKDYFYISYLYYQLGQEYNSRALDMALKAYDKGYRSSELVALLANLQFLEAETKDDYQSALNYYQTLGDALNDPILIYNKALTLKALGEHNRATDLFERGEKFVSRSNSYNYLFDQFRLATIRLALEQKQFDQCIKLFQNTPTEHTTLRMRTVYSRCLLQRGEKKLARMELERIVKQSDAPQRAKILLRQLNEPKETK